jgi:undecaprenyl-diphosphatase
MAQRKSQLTAAVLLIVPFALLAALVVGAWSPLLTLDARLAEWLHSATSANPGVAAAMQLWTDTFAPGPLRALVVVVAVWLWWRGDRLAAAWAVVTMAVGALLSTGLKLLFSRDRPEFLDPVSKAAGYSFPSGHSMTAALGAGVLLLTFLPYAADAASARTQTIARWAMVVGAVVVTAATGLTRIALGVHWLSDVVAGWALGFAVLVVTTAAFPKRTDE